MSADVARDNEILRIQTGSTVYGVSVGGSDRDEMGVFIEPKTHVIGLERQDELVFRTAAKGAKSGPGDLDLTIYSLRKFVRLCEQGNPSILLGLHTPPEFIITTSPEADRLRESAGLFLSKDVGKRFLGYLHQQKLKATGQWARGDTTQRPELVEQYGFDTKFAAHMVRLGVMGYELLTTGSVTMPMIDVWADWLKELRKGRRTLAEALEYADHFEMIIGDFIHTDALPARPDRKAVNALLIELHEGYWAKVDQ